MKIRQITELALGIASTLWKAYDNLTKLICERLEMAEV